MNVGWRYLADESVLELISGPTLSARDRRKLSAALRRLVDHPGQPASLLGFDRAGRPLSVITDGEFEIVYWVDHAGREVRITSVFRD